jgi:protoporphyrinogen IX oxidase
VYLWLKTFHIIGVVVWFAGLFYIVRLFVYHREADTAPDEERVILQRQFSVMESRLYTIITTPGMWVTLGTASALLWSIPAYLHQGWMQAKLSLVLCLLLYHLWCGRLMRQLQSGACQWTPQRLRGFNELPTLFLVTIVMLVVFKSAFPTEASVWLIFSLTVSMIVAIQLYAKKRRRDAQSASKSGGTEIHTEDHKDDYSRGSQEVRDEQV